MGRPRKHDRPTIVRAICRDVAEGELVNVACKAYGTTAGQLRAWVQDDKELSALYARAREDQAHALAEQAIQIAHGDDATTIAREEAIDAIEEDTKDKSPQQLAAHYKMVAALRAGNINRDRMRLDALKWMTSKIAPRSYGEKVTVGTEDGKPIEHVHRVVRWGNVEIPL